MAPAPWPVAVRKRYDELNNGLMLPEYFDILDNADQFWAIDYWEDEALHLLLGKACTAKAAVVAIGSHRRQGESLAEEL